MRFWIDARRRWRLQFGLFAGLVATSLVAVVLARVSSQARQQVEFVRAVQRHEGTVTYSPRRTLSGVLARQLGRSIGQDYGQKVIGVNLRQRSLDARLLAEIGCRTGLRSLDLRACQLSDDDVQQLSELRDLRYLDVSWNRITDGSLKVIGQLRQLRYLNLSRNSIGAGGMSELSGLTLLNTLVVNQTLTNSRCLEQIGQLERLTNLEIADTHVDHEGIAVISSLEHLNRLRIGPTGWLAPRSVEVLRQFKSLSHLSLVGQDVGDAEMAVFLELPALRYLHLERGQARLSPVMMKRLSQQSVLVIQGKIVLSQ